jgi:hypothetical protein
MKGKCAVLFESLSLCSLDGSGNHNMNRPLGLNPGFSDREAGTIALDRTSCLLLLLTPSRCS